VPLSAVVACLPMDLRSKLMAAPPSGLTVHLAMETVISQLAFGSVKISFGELRRLAPGIFVNSGGEFDNKLVSLPLQEILGRLNPALLSRRAIRKIEVSEEITGPFDGRGRGLTFSTKPLKAPAAPLSPQAQEPSGAVETPSAFVPSGREISPPSSATPAAPQLTPQFPRSLTPAAPPPRGIIPAPQTGFDNGHTHGHGVNNGRSQFPPPAQPPASPALPPGLRLASNGGNVPPPALRLSPLPSPSAAPAPAAPPTIFATVGDLCENWPESLKEEILRSPFAEAIVPLEGSVILPGLKRGRIVMPWKQIRLLARPGSQPSPNDHLEVELPLKVIAPLFLAAQKNPMRAQTKAPVSADIPDLFFGFPQPANTPASPAAPVVEPVVPPLPRQATQKAGDSNYYVWADHGESLVEDEPGLRRGAPPQTDFVNRQAHPREVVERALDLPGIAGAVVAMQDGLRVASQVPSHLNADTLAAFLPQIFERVNHCTRELRMGALNNINFTVGNVPWKIFRVNAVYFAAFGRSGESLPSTQLAQLAAELDRKK